ncbi:MAG: PIN domain-containing protein [Bacteroidota bacterium]
MLLDSVILIDYLNGISDAEAFIDAHPSAVISVITLAEVLAGVDDAGEDALRQYLATFRVLELDRAIAERAAALRRAERWKLPDAIQAAFAQHHGIRLVTRNTKDFEPERHAFVLIPYTL